VDVSYGLEIGDSRSGGPCFATLAEADAAGRIIADTDRVEVTVYRFEAARGDGILTDILQLYVLHAGGG
jgi:hypothetical protein